MTDLDKPRELVVMSWAGGWGRALREAVCEPFSEETGIAVRQAYHVGLLLPQALHDALGAAERPPFDVVWCNAVPALAAEAAGHCAPLSDLQGLDRLSARAHPGGAPGRPLVFPYVAYYVLVYQRALHARPPQSWSVLLEPKHRVALYPRGNGLVPIAQVMGSGRVADIPRSMEPCWRFIRSLAPQVAELDYSIGMERLLSDGSLTLCLRALPNALAFQAAGLDVGFSVPAEGTSDTLDALWVPRGLPSATSFWARRLVEFALRPAVQQHLCEALGCMPVHPDARPPSLISAHPRLPRDADDVETVLHIPEELKVEHDEEWARRFELEMARGRREPQGAVSEARGSSSKSPPTRQIS